MNIFLIFFNKILLIVLIILHASFLNEMKHRSSFFLFLFFFKRSVSFSVGKVLSSNIHILFLAVKTRYKFGTTDLSCVMKGRKMFQHCSWQERLIKVLDIFTQTSYKCHYEMSDNAGQCHFVQIFYCLVYYLTMSKLHQLYMMIWCQYQPSLMLYIVL